MLFLDASLAKALKELGEFQEAIDTLERAENMSKEQAKVVQKYKLEIIEEHKKSVLKLEKWFLGDTSQYEIDTVINFF